MKRILTLAAIAAFALSSCNNDDNNTSAPLTAGYLEGVWVEIAPNADYNMFAFHGSKATLSQQFNAGVQYNYQISGNKILLSTEAGTAAPTQHDVEIVNDSVVKIGNLLIAGPAENPTSGTITFKKTNIIID